MRVSGAMIFGWLCVASTVLVSAARGVDVPPSVLEAEQARIATIDRIKDTVVAIFAADGGGGGSGVCISADGEVVTNFHVVAPCGPAMKCGMADGRIYDAVIVGIDPTGDLAMIKMLGRDDFPYAALADSNTVQVGDEALVLGNPFLLANTLYPTVTAGIISGTHRYQYPSGTFLEYTDCLQTDASVNPGNSGGPLFNAAGDVIGINGRCSFEKRGRINVGVGWAVSSNQVRNFLGVLRSGRFVDHATAGFTVATDSSQRVVVDDILDASDARRRGLDYDDEVIAFGGRPIDTANAFKNVLGVFPKGWRVPLSFRHDGERHDVYVRLRGLHSEAEMLKATQVDRARPTPMPLPPRERKSPDDQPDGDSPGPGDDEPPPGGLPLLPIELMPTAPVIPEAIRAFYEEKPGYANYYFNRVNRDRVLNRWKAGMNSLGDGTWTLAGPIDGGGDFRFEIGENAIDFELPAERGAWKIPDAMGNALEPNGSGGLFAALALWRRLAVAPIESQGNVYYEGTAPWPGRDAAADVVVVVDRGVACWFYFDVDSGRLVAIELFGDDASDPCEVELSDYADGDSPLPSCLKVRCGDLHFATFRLAR